MTAAVLALALFAHGTAASARRPYDEKADARAEIQRMLGCAKEEGKPLLLMFGANWCPWCRELDRRLETDPALARILESRYLRFNVDIGEYDRNLDVAASYGVVGLEDTGIPIVVVLGADGRVGAVKDADDFVVGEKYRTARIQAFLEAAAGGSPPAPNR